MRTPLLLSALIVALLAVPAPAGADQTWVRPVPGSVLRAFDPPAQRWGSGHRGVDLDAEAGSVVVAAGQGTVSFAGLVAGRPVVSIDHGDVRTTYEPVAAVVARGQPVEAGQAIGTIVAGHCSPQACLHWGAVRRGDYLDPVSLLTRSRVRLLAAGDADRPRTPTPVSVGLAAGAARSLAVDGAVGGFARPADGPVTSGFGSRLHPILRVWKLHDGTDYGAPCGSAIRSVAAGVVTQRTVSPAYGQRLVVDHGLVTGRRLVISYNHAQGFGVDVGTRVAAGQVIGTVGTTGLSTGCHLHLQAWVDGVLADPQRVLG